MPSGHQGASEEVIEAADRCWVAAHQHDALNAGDQRVDLGFAGRLLGDQHRVAPLFGLWRYRRTRSSARPPCFRACRPSASVPCPRPPTTTESPGRRRSRASAPDVALGEFVDHGWTCPAGRSQWHFPPATVPGRAPSQQVGDLANVLRRVIAKRQVAILFKVLQLWRDLLAGASSRRAAPRRATRSASCGSNFSRPQTT
jgi:hypothetical protein